MAALKPKAAKPLGALLTAKLQPARRIVVLTGTTEAKDMENADLRAGGFKVVSPVVLGAPGEEHLAFLAGDSLELVAEAAEAAFLGAMVAG